MFTLKGSVSLGWPHGAFGVDWGEAVSLVCLSGATQCVEVVPYAREMLHIPHVEPSFCCQYCVNYSGCI